MSLCFPNYSQSVISSGSNIATAESLGCCSDLPVDIHCKFSPFQVNLYMFSIQHPKRTASFSFGRVTMDPLSHTSGIFGPFRYKDVTYDELRRHCGLIGWSLD